MEEPDALTSKHFYEDGRELIRPALEMQPHEAELNITASLKICEWLNDKGVNMYVANNGSYVHESVPRKILETK